MKFDKRLALFGALFLLQPPVQAEQAAVAVTPMLQPSPPPPFGPYVSSRQVLPPMDAAGNEISEPAWNAWLPRTPDHRPYAGPGRYWSPAESATDVPGGPAANASGR